MHVVSTPDNATVPHNRDADGTPQPPSRARTLAISSALIVLVALLYLPGLGDSPVSGDELFMALTARNVAFTGRDMHGRRLPFYFQMAGPFNHKVWFQPIPIYAMAAALKVRPLSEATIRLPMVVFGVVNVLLMYSIGRRLFRHELLAVGAAVLLCLAPIHFSYSRIALDFLALVPFVLGWLLCVVTYFDIGQRRWLVAAGGALGIGTYTYAAAYAVMPLLAVATAAVLLWRRDSAANHRAFAVGLAIPLVAGILVVLSRPAIVSDMFQHYRDQEPQSSMAASTSPPPFAQRLEDAGKVYASLWNPRVLFAGGRQSRWLLGLVPLPLGGFLVAAAATTWRRRRKPNGRGAEASATVRFTSKLLVLVAGVVIGPVPAALVVQYEAVHRATVMAPFAILLALVGFEIAWDAEESDRRRAAFIAGSMTVLALVLVYRSDLPNGQALVRIATVPLAAAGLASLLKELGAWRGYLVRITVVSAVVGLAMQVAYARKGDPIWIGSATLGLVIVSTGAIATDVFARLGRRPVPVLCALATLANLFAFTYIDRAPDLWAGRTAVLPLARWTSALAAFAIMVIAIDRVPAVRLDARRRAWIVFVTLVAVEIAYFYIGFSDRFLVRSLTTIVVPAGVVSVAMFERDAIAAGIARMTVAAAVVLFGVQYGEFYVRNATEYAQHASVDLRQARAAFEAAIVRAPARDAAIYASAVGPLEREYWAFYALKHQRPDLTALVQVDEYVYARHLLQLPPSGIAVIGRSDAAIAAMDALSGRPDWQADILAPGEQSSVIVLQVRRPAGVAPAPSERPRG